MLNNRKFVELFVTFFYIGKIKYAPGTFGSLAAFPLCYLITYFLVNNQFAFVFTDSTILESQIITLFISILIPCLLLFILGAYYSSIYVQGQISQDPKEVVIDEVVGQMLTIILSFVSIVFVQYSELGKSLSPSMINLIFLFALPFILFRFFDIVKPWPINWLDANLKGGIGIMIDDVVASIFASVIHYVIVFTLIDWFN